MYGCSLWVAILLHVQHPALTTSAQIPVGNFFHVHNNVALESKNTIANAWRTTPSATLALTAGVTLTGSTTTCRNTGRTSEFRMALSANGTTVSWACYIAAAGINPLNLTTVRRGVNSVLQTGVISTTTLAAGAYVRGIVNAAVADDAGGFYVSGDVPIAVSKRTCDAVNGLRPRLPGRLALSWPTLMRPDSPPSSWRSMLQS